MTYIYEIRNRLRRRQIDHARKAHLALGFLIVTLAAWVAFLIGRGT